jgi:hypothetical protein
MVRVAFIGEFAHFADLDDLMRKYHIAKCVIDALPETRKCRNFAARHPGKVFLCYYSDYQKNEATWSPEKTQVTVNRTELLDRSHYALANGETVLPQESETISEFAQHCSNVARVLHKDPESGLSRYAYIQTGADHYRHSFGYCLLALSQAVTGFFSNCNLE